jgi:hypothetical protein
LHQDGFGEFLADTETGIADLANEGGISGEEFDLLFFAETHFTQAIAHFGGDRKLLDGNDGAGLDLGQRTHLRPGTTAFQDFTLMRQFLLHQGQK